MTNISHEILTTLNLTEIVIGILTFCGIIYPIWSKLRATQLDTIKDYYTKLDLRIDKQVQMIDKLNKELMKEKENSIQCHLEKVELKIKVEQLTARIEILEHQLKG